MGITSLSIMTAILAAAGLGAPDAPPSQWALESMVPGGPLCRGMKSGDRIDIQIARNKLDHLMMFAGHPDWDHKSGPIHVTISVDGGPPISLEGFVIGPIVMVEVTSDALTKQLRGAHAVRWDWPWGHFTATIDGLGKALDSIAYCPG